MRMETDIPTYELLVKCLSELNPDIEVELIETDPALKNLGFVKEVPCTIEIKATDEQILEIEEMALDFEIEYLTDLDDAGVTAQQRRESEKNYKRYGWLNGFFDEAED